MAWLRDIFSFASANSVLFIVLVILIGVFIYIMAKNFKITFKKGFPTFQAKDYDKLRTDLALSQKEVESLKEQLEFSQTADFFKKTENGEYIGYMVAKRPYITIWVDGNWNTEEHHLIIDRFERLWDDESEVLFIGKSPNVPSDIYHIIEKKAKSLPHITLKCPHQLGEFFHRYFADFPNVTIEVRG